MNSTDIISRGRGLVGSSKCENGHLKKKAGGTVHDNNPQIVVHTYEWGRRGGNNSYIRMKENKAGDRGKSVNMY